MNLSKISFPVFRLGEVKPQVEGTLSFYSKEYVTHESETSRFGFRIIDDTSVEGSTLGLRRLKLKQLGVPLFFIKQAIYFLGDLIKRAKSGTWFIDSNGYIFTYKKSSRAKLTCHKLKDVYPLHGMGAVIEAQGISTRFKCMYSPSPNELYVGVLRWGLGYILYGFYEEPFKSTHRLV